MNSVKLEPTFFLPDNRKNYSCKGKENKLKRNYSYYRAKVEQS